MRDEPPIPREQCPPELPKNPSGWRRRMEMHMSLGGGGIGIYTLIDDQGRVMPIQYQYDTQKPKPAGPRGGKAVVPGPTGYVIVDRRYSDGFYGEVQPTWGKLREVWEAWMRGDPNPSPDSVLKEAP